MVATAIDIKPGIYPGMDWETYRCARGLNASTIKQARNRSMKHLRHAIDNPGPDSPSMVVGRATHTAVFESREFGSRYAIWEGGARRGAEWKQFEADNQGLEILKIEEAEKAVNAGTAAVNHPLVAEVVDEGKAEVSLFWEDQGIMCKGRIDWLRMRGEVYKAIVDLKTARDIHHFAFGRQFEKLAYHWSLGFYRRGMRILTGKTLPVYVIAQENDEPFDTVRVPIHEEILDLGEQECVGVIQQAAHCKKHNYWPGICEDDDYPLSFPEYAMPNDDVKLVIGGQEVAV